MARSPQSPRVRPRLLRVDPGIGWRIRRFLGSPGHVLGALAALGGVILLDAGLIHLPLAALVIGGLYLIGYFVAARPQLSTLGQDQTKDADQIEAGLDELLATIRKRVAIDVYRHVLGIRDAVVFTLQHAGDRYQADPDFYSVRQTAMTYLPEALSRYLALPRPYAEQERLADGKTAHDTLIEQLQLMEDNTRRVADTIVERESQRLIIHGRFLSERLGASSLDPTQPSPPVPLAPVPAAAPVAQPVASQSRAEAQQVERQTEREKVRVV
ncbi:MAG TPA: hypothetical protein VIK08_00165 [Candidatus Limnocylindrales bacterium]